VGFYFRSLRRRWSRRSLKLCRNQRNRSPDSGTDETASVAAAVSLANLTAAEAERMLEEREEELRRRLQGFEDGTTKLV
jgi:hypothetical protein